MRADAADAAAWDQNLAALAQALQDLAQAAHPWLAQAQAAPAATAPDDGALAQGPQRYAALLDMLRQQDMDAGAALHALQPWLRHQGLPAARFDEVATYVDGLDYALAVDLLLQWRAPATAA